MWNDTADGQDLIGTISKQIVADVAPEELEFFDELAHEEKTAVAPRSSGDEQLGFGLSEAVTMFTPATISVVTAVLTFLGTEVLKTAGKEIAAEMVSNLKAHFFEPTYKLTDAQLKAVRQIADKTAKENGLADDAADKLTDSLIASLTK